MRVLQANGALVMTAFAIALNAFPLFSQSTDIHIRHLMSISEGVRSPFRMAVKDEFVYLTDATSNKVCVFDSSGALVTQLKTETPPMAIALHASNGFYLSSRTISDIQLITQDGVASRSFAPDTLGWKNATCFATDGGHELYVVDSRRHSVFVVDTRTGTSRLLVGNRLIFPTGIAFDSKNQRIIVTEHGGLSASTPLQDASKMVHAFSKEGKLLASFGEYGFQPGEFARIQGVTVDQLGRIYVADIYNNFITVLDDKGKFVTQIGRVQAARGELLAPMDLAIDAANRLWVASMNTGTLEIFDLTPLLEEDVVFAGGALPNTTALMPNYPNPFNPGTWIPFVLTEQGDVVISIYNGRGQVVRRFVLGELEVGVYIKKGRAVYWDGRDRARREVASGIYFCKLQSGSKRSTRKMILLK